MKQRTNTSTVVTSGISQTTQFQIKAVGKAFRSLIDGIYSDKILAPVRELMTNAYDGHLMAGNEDEPFKVVIPDNLFPEFVVRDYGAGMDHETVMRVYTTLFDSTKDDTNDQVGMLGLGSKSPFAYTDTYTVTCFDGQTKRVYNAHLVNDMPHLGLMYEGESSEPRGVEVKFPVRVSDFSAFNDAIERTALGFDVRPTFEGGTIEERETIHEGPGYRLFSSAGWNDSLTAFNVRMGCVIYPIGKRLRHTSYESMQVPQNVKYVIDVPIGTSDVTTSRESLAQDDESVKAIAPYLEAAIKDHKDTTLAGFEMATTQREKVEFLHTVPREWRAAWKLPQQLHLTLLDSDRTTLPSGTVLQPGEYVQQSYGHGRFVDRKTFLLNIDVRNSVRIVIDDGVTVRRRQRIKDFTGYNRDVYIVPAGHDKTVDNLKARWGLKDSQFTKVADITDPGPPARNGTSARTGKREAMKRIADGQPWVNKMRGVVYPTPWAQGGTGRVATITIVDNAWLAEVLGIDDWQNASAGSNRALFDEHVVCLTDKMIKDWQPDPERELGRVLRAEFEASGLHYEIVERLKLSKLQRALRQALSGANSADMVMTSILKANGVDTDTVKLTSKQMEMMTTVTRAYDVNSYVNAHVSPQELHEVQGFVSDSMAALRRQYPLLFPLDSQEAIEYIREQTPVA